MLSHGPRQVASWLIFDVGQNSGMTLRVLRVIAGIMIIFTLGIGAWIFYLAPNERLLTVASFSLLSLGIWWVFRVKEHSLFRWSGRIDEGAGPSRRDRKP